MSKKFFFEKILNLDVKLSKISMFKSKLLNFFFKINLIK